MEQTLIFNDNSFDKSNPYDPWEKMNEAIKNYRKNEKLEAIVFSQNPAEDTHIEIDIKKILAENRE